MSAGAGGAGGRGCCVAVGDVARDELVEVLGLLSCAVFVAACDACALVGLAAEALCVACRCRGWGGGGGWVGLNVVGCCVEVVDACRVGVDVACCDEVVEVGEGRRAGRRVRRVMYAAAAADRVGRSKRLPGLIPSSMSVLCSKRASYRLTSGVMLGEGGVTEYRPGAAAGEAGRNMNERVAPGAAPRGVARSVGVVY